MSRHASKEAFYQRLQELAEVKKPLIKETRNLGTLIDYKKAADGNTYGIVKEQHHYYIKKAGSKQNPNVSDFAYIGGLENIKEYQYDKLSEADKQRSMILHNINEAFTLKPNKTSSKLLKEDKAGEEIEKASEKVPELDAATDAAAEPEVPAVDDGGDAEMAAGLEAEPAGGEEMPAEEPAPEGGEEMPAPEGGEEMPAEMPAPEGEEGEEEVPAEPEGGEEMPAEEPAEDDVESGPKDEIKSDIGKIGEKIQERDLSNDKVDAYVSMFLGYFTDYFANMDIEQRKEIADKILEVSKEKNIEDLEASMPSEPVGLDGEVDEDICAECGGFGRYAESRGYSAESLMECDAEELSNVISGYANAHNDGQNDGDFKLVALFVNPEVLGKLKNEYGHEDYTEKLTPYSNELNECGLEEKQAQINELWGGLKNMFGKVGGDVKAGAQKAGQAVAGAAQKGAQAVGGAIQKGAQAVKGAAQQGAQAVGQYATGVKQAYHAGEVPNELKKLTKDAETLGKQVAALNTRLQKAGQQPVNVQSLLTTIKNQLGGAAGAVNLNKYGAASEGVTDPANVEVQPNMLKEDDEPEEKKGEIDMPEIDKPIDGVGFAPEADILGGGVMKPDGAGVEIKVTPDKTVNISMNESEKKLRKYIRERLEVKTGLKKGSLNEAKKSETLKKLDKVIDEQFKLYESVISKKKVVEEGINDVILKGVTKVGQMGTGKNRLQSQLKDALSTLTPDQYTKWLSDLFAVDTMYNQALAKSIYSATPENKLEVLQQIAADEHGVGDISMQNNRLVYIPVAQAKNLKKLNEISTGYADINAKKAYQNAKSMSSTNPVGAELKYQQGDKFDRYINPVLEKEINALGFTLKKYGRNEFYLIVPKSSGDNLMIAVSPDKYKFVDGTVSDIQPILRKVQVAIQKIQKDLQYKAPNEL